MPCGRAQREQRERGLCRTSRGFNHDLIAAATSARSTVNAPPQLRRGLLAAHPGQRRAIDDHLQAGQVRQRDDARRRGLEDDPGLDDGRARVDGVDARGLHGITRVGEHQTQLDAARPIRRSAVRVSAKPPTSERLSVSARPSTSKVASAAIGRIPRLPAPVRSSARGRSGARLCRSPPCRPSWRCQWSTPVLPFGRDERVVALDEQGGARVACATTPCAGLQSRICLMTRVDPRGPSRCQPARPRQVASSVNSLAGGMAYRMSRRTRTGANPPKDV